MGEVEKVDEEKRMEGRRLNEDEEDHKATLWYDLEKEMREIFEEFHREPKLTATILFDYEREITILETEYEKAGLSWEEIREVKRGIINGKN